MADDVLSSFLIKIAYDQDQRSRQKFDEGLKQAQTHAAEFGAKIGELPTIVSEATKRISASLTELWYASQKTGASAEQIDALRRAAEQSGEGADNAQRSWEGWSETFRKFGDAAAQQLKSIYGIKYDPKDSFGAFLQAREKASKEYNEATDKEGKGRAIARAGAVSIEEEALVKRRQDIFGPYFEKQLKANSGLEAEKAAALTRAYNALADAIETVTRKADAALFDKFGAVLDRLTKWLDEDSERVVKFFTELATQIGLVFTDLAKLSPAFALLWAALKEVGSWLQKIIGQPDAGGLAGVRHLLEFISGVVMARFVASMVAGFALAFGPVTALLTALGALGVIAYTGGWFEGGGGSSGFGAGEGEGSSGHGDGQGEGSSGQGGSGGGANLGKEGWWTPERQKHAYDKLRAGGLSDMGAKGLISRWVNVESPRGPASENAISGGHFGIGQWSRARGSSIWGNTDFDTQLDLVVKESKSAAEAIAGRLLRDAQTPEEGARAATAYERAEHYNRETHIDDWTDKTQRGIERVSKAIGEAGKAIGEAGKVSSGQDVIPGQGDPHKPGFDPSSVKFHDFHKALDTIRNAKPLVPWQQSMNEIHDYRSVESVMNFNITGASQADMVGDSLGRRPKNADLIRNTTSYAS